MSLPKLVIPDTVRLHALERLVDDEGYKVCEEAWKQAINRYIEVVRGFNDNHAKLSYNQGYLQGMIDAAETRKNLIVGIKKALEKENE